MCLPRQPERRRTSDVSLGELINSRRVAWPILDPATRAPNRGETNIPESIIPDPLPVAGFQVPLRVSFTGMKKVRHLALFYNQIFPQLILYADGIEFRVFIKRKKSYSQVERIEALETFATHNVIIVWKDSAFAFVGNVRDEKLFHEYLSINLG
jgi:hypothetical protein